MQEEKGKEQGCGRGQVVTIPALSLCFMWLMGSWKLCSGIFGVYKETEGVCDCPPHFWEAAFFLSWVMEAVLMEGGS